MVEGEHHLRALLPECLHPADHVHMLAAVELRMEYARLISLLPELLHPVASRIPFECLGHQFVPVLGETGAPDTLKIGVPHYTVGGYHRVVSLPVLMGPKHVVKHPEIVVAFQGIKPVVITARNIKSPGDKGFIHLPGGHPDATPVIALDHHQLPAGAPAGNLHQVLGHTGHYALHQVSHFG